MAIGVTNFPTSLDTVAELIEAANNSTTTLNGALDNSTTTITVASTSSFPSSGTISIDSEIISYTGKTGTTFTGCTRAFEGTSAASHDDGATVDGEVTARHHNVLASALIVVETKLGYGSSTSTANTVLLGNGTGTSAWGAVTNAYIDASAAIAVSKLAAVTASRALVSDASGFLSASAVTSTELGYVSGVTSAIQTQLNAKQAAFSDQNANIVYAGPATGAAAAPAFRSLVAADIPDISATYLTVATAGSTYLTISNAASTYQPLDSDLTAIAALSPTDDDIIQRKAGAWTNRTMAQLKTDLSLSASDVGLGSVENTALSTWAGSSNITTLGTVTTGTLSTGAVIGGVTMTLGTDGTGDIYYRSAGGVLTRLAAGTDGHVLTLASGLPSWAAASGGGLTVGTTAIASGTAGRILYETSGNVLGEIAGSSADSSGAVQFAASARTSGVAQYFRVNTPADTTLTASTESVGVYIGGNGSGSTVTRQWSTGALTTQREYVFVAPTYAFSGASTLTTAATVTITGAPTAGTNATITNALSLNVEAGRVRFPTGTYGSNVVQFGANDTGFTSTGSAVAIRTGGAQHVYFGGSQTVLLDSYPLTWSSIPGGVAGNVGIARAATGVLRISNASTGAGKLVIGSSSASTSAADLYVVGSSASLVPFQVDSAASPSVDVFRVSADNGTTTHFKVTSTGAAALAGTGAGSYLTITGVVYDVGIQLAATGATKYIFIDQSADQLFLGSQVPGTAGPTQGVRVRGSGQSYAFDVGGLSSGGTSPGQINIASLQTTRPAIYAESLANTSVALAQYYLNANDTNTVAPHSVFSVDSNGTAATGFGGQLQFQLESSTTNQQDAAAINWIWTDATHASRTAKLQFQLVGNAAALATVAEFDMDTTAGNTRLLIYDVDNATLERVTVGAADSGGSGFKVLRIPN